MKQLKILQIGCGIWGKLILRDLKILEQHVSVIARSEKSVNNAIEFKADQIYRSFSEALDSSTSFDAAVVVVNLPDHFQVLCDLIKNYPNLPIFCEKEVCFTAAQAREIERQAGERVFVMHKWRYHQGILKLSELLKSGELGHLQALKLERLGWGTLHDSQYPVQTLIPHDLSIVHELLGYLPEVVAARIDQPQSVLHGISILLGSHPWVQIEASDHAASYRRSVQAFCERGTLILEDSYSSAIKLFEYPSDAFCGTPEPRLIEFKNTMPLLDELNAFCQYVQGKSDAPKSPISDSIAILDRIESAIKLGLIAKLGFNGQRAST